MLIVKPYGRSAAVKDPSKGVRRMLHKRNEDGFFEFETFCRKHPDLVLAQWISVIDKIARKPTMGKRPSAAQRCFRQRIGDAVWLRLAKDGIVPDDFKKKFWSKIHPYPDQDIVGKTRLQGRWYKRFLGEACPDAVDLTGLADKIFDHLYETAYRIGPTRPNKSDGLIAARAKSISRNTLKQAPGLGAMSKSWSKEDEEVYKTVDIAAKIRAKAKVLEGQELKRGVFMRDISPILSEQYGRLFHNANHEPLPIRDAKTIYPGLFVLHETVKEVYKRRLSGHKSVKHKSVANVLPTDMDALFRLIHNVRRNTRIAALIRTGKIAHYEAAPNSIVDDWPADRLTDSDYWTSDRQDEIKRNEAFVRVWRTALPHAIHTLTDWVDPRGDATNDVMTQSGCDAVLRKFDAAAFDSKAVVLFGNRSAGWRGQSLENKKACWLAIQNILQELRNSSFHFKGIDGFIESINRAAETPMPGELMNLWKQDSTDQSGRLVKMLEGAKANTFLSQDQLSALFAALDHNSAGIISLPRFRRMMARREKAWSKAPFKIRLPRLRNHQEMENAPALLCQHICLKLLYERSFPTWIERRETCELQGWINRSIGRTTSAARKINRDASVVAHVAGMMDLRDGDMINTFIDRLAAETASEIRIQKSYDPNPEVARRKSVYLDNLNCDVMAQAFAEFLKEKQFNWLLNLNPKTKIPRDTSSSFELLTSQTRDKPAAQPWQCVLYVILHLLPGNNAARLLHQLRKWNILERKLAERSPRAVVPFSNRSDHPSKQNQKFDPSSDPVRLFEVFTLYLDMHDAKFEGNERLTRIEEMAGLFESERAFREIFPTQSETPDDTQLPLRGLREMLRFGNLKYLKPIFERYRITDQEVSDLKALENREDGTSKIVKAQKKREYLHAEWVRDKHGFSQDKQRSYWNALSTVTRHRYLVTRIRLADHVRLHNLLMQILGRMVDFSGLWERDLYFTTLGLMIERQKTPESVLNEQGRRRLANGQILSVLDRGMNDGEIRREMQYLFGRNYLSDRSRQIRNDLAHFNMLRARDDRVNLELVPPDLTKLVNDCRSLMRYDRKLKNAVSKSIIDLMAREKLDLRWTMTETDYRLACAKIRSQQAVHLSNRRIRENLHGKAFVAMTAALFVGKSQASDNDILSVDFNRALKSKTTEDQQQGKKVRRKE